MIWLHQLKRHTNCHPSTQVFQGTWRLHREMGTFLTLCHPQSRLGSPIMIPSNNEHLTIKMQLYVQIHNLQTEICLLCYLHIRFFFNYTVKKEKHSSLSEASICTSLRLKELLILYKLLYHLCYNSASSGFMECPPSISFIPPGMSSKENKLSIVPENVVYFLKGIYL